MSIPAPRKSVNAPGMKLPELPTKNHENTTTIMPNPLNPQTEESRQMLYVIGSALLAGTAHIGRMLYENKPVPLKKAVGGAILTLCVGGALGALCVSYWHLPGSVVAAGACLIGFIGGPVVLSILAKIGQKALEKKAADMAGTESPAEEKP